MKKECETVTIKEVSQKYNISSDTLRYYERVGMIPPAVSYTHLTLPTILRV